MDGFRDGFRCGRVFFKHEDLKLETQNVQFQTFGQPQHNSMQEGVARIRISSNSLWNPHENSASTESHLNLDSIVFPEQQNFDNPFS